MCFYLLNAIFLYSALCGRGQVYVGLELVISESSLKGVESHLSSLAHH